MTLKRFIHAAVPVLTLVATVGGQDFPSTFVRHGIEFKKRGEAPLKARVIFTVCQMALYTPDGVSKKDILGDVPKALELHYNYDISAEDFAKSADKPLRRNITPRQYAQIAPAVARINRLYRNVRKGDRYRLVFVPGKGADLFLNGTLLGNVPGNDFGEHYYKIWIGKDPLDEGARDALLQNLPAEGRYAAMPEKAADKSDSVYQFTVASADGKDVPLENYRGNVLLIVNVASKCGFTSQYEGLQKLHDKFASKGFSVLGFPCNQFGNQEPGTDEQIQTFCSTNFGVTFPVFSKVEVNGDGAHPLYKFLTREAPGLLGSKRIKWNFTKFLIDTDGKVVERFGSAKKPDDLAPEIEKLLK